jgi:peptidoglycan LD-endopeptidase LytH
MKGFWKRFAIALAAVLLLILTLATFGRQRHPASQQTGSGVPRGEQKNFTKASQGRGAAAASKQRPPLPSVDETDYRRLTARHLTFPVPSARMEGLVDTFSEARGSARQHEALDIIAEFGVPVVAVEDGTIAKLFNSQGGGGLTVYQFDPSNEYCYYYAHLSGYAPGLKDGMSVKRGDQIGYVGMTGNARTPHLHFAISKLGPDKVWWRGTALNPYSLFRSDGK